MINEEEIPDMMRDFEGRLDPDWFGKPTNWTELSFMFQLRQTGLVPEFYTKVREDGEMILYTKRYPMTLGDYLQDVGDIKEFQNKITSMIHQLHDEGIAHGDLHPWNVVMNPDTKDLRFIDLETAEILVFDSDINAKMIQEDFKILHWRWPHLDSP